MLILLSSSEAASNAYEQGEQKGEEADDSQ